ncbi:MAG: amidohydrolase family protein [Finegoldia sp.]|nr:amidohydrolase family protein [Finegoldia sp.]
MKNIKAIDTHSHLWTDEYLDMLKKFGSEETDVARDMGAFFTIDEMDKRLEMMDKAGVEVQVISATPQSPYFGSEEETLKSAILINDTYREVLDKYPDRFLAYGAVPLPYVDTAIGEAKRLVNDLSFQGIAINTYIKDEYPFEEKFYPFWEAVNDLNTIVYIHPTGKGACCPMVNDKGLEWVVGAPIEDMLSILHLLKSDIPYKYKNIKFHIAHLGGGIGFQMQRVEDNYEDWDAFRESPTETLSHNFYFDSANFLEEALNLSVEVFGEDKILLGSDFPYFKDEKYIRAVDYIKDSRLSDRTKEKILRENAERLYKLVKKEIEN